MAFNMKRLWGRIFQGLLAILVVLYLGDWIIRLYGDSRRTLRARAFSPSLGGPLLVAGTA
jgi:hypothetical protein